MYETESLSSHLATLRSLAGEAGEIRLLPEQRDLRPSLRGLLGRGESTTPVGVFVDAFERTERFRCDGQKVALLIELFAHAPPLGITRLRKSGHFLRPTAFRNILRRCGIFPVANCVQTHRLVHFARCPAAPLPSILPRGPTRRRHPATHYGSANDQGRTGSPHEPSSPHAAGRPSPATPFSIQGTWQPSSVDSGSSKLSGITSSSRKARHGPHIEMRFVRLDLSCFQQQPIRHLHSPRGLSLPAMARPI